MAISAETIEPGQVWWCDGVALEFEPHFKRRPVLLLAVGERLLVAPLSSKRVQGQEQAVTHRGGVSYLTGKAVEISADALLSPLGAWDGFADWRAAQEDAAHRAERFVRWIARLRAWFTG